MSDKDTLPGFESLDALMAREGVRSLDRAKAPRAPRRAPEPPVKRGGEPSPVKAPRREEAALAARVSELEAALEAVEERAASLAGERARALVRGQALELRVGELEEALASQGQALEEARRPRPLPPPPAALRGLLEQRGLLAEEQAAALALLLEGGEQGLLEALRVEDPLPLAKELQDRLMLSCGREGCRPEGRVAWLEVALERCELCGGTDLGQAFGALLRACRRAGVRRLVLVGGSPTYRDKLRGVASPHRKELRLELVDGSARTSARKVQGLARNADLVVLWASTIVDHATGDAFKAAGARLLVAPIRGMARMLAFVAEALSA